MAGGAPLVVVEASRALAPSSAGPLADVGGWPGLQLALRRLAPLRAQAGATVVVATTDQPADDDVATIGEEEDARVVRGPADDPLRTLSMAHVRFGADDVVRLDGAAPLVDPFVVVAALELHRDAAADYTSNLLPRTYPRGLDVEVLSGRALRACELDATDLADRSDPTALVRRHPDRFRFANLHSGHDLADEDWTIHDRAGLDRVRNAVAQVPDPLTASWNRILSVAGRSAKPKPGELRLRPLAPSAPGDVPWVRRWAVIVDGQQIGTSEVATDGTGSTRTSDVPEPWTEAARDALFRVLLDPRTPTS